ncbi:MAG: RagB/SusD family nutrient uptake outer membrane protein [Bacteroidales bacterium]
MKKFIYLITACIGFTSCTDLLTEDPESYYDSKQFFTSVENAEMAVIGVYDVLANLNHYGQIEMAMPTSDDIYYISGVNTDNSRRDISHYMTSTHNTWINSSWGFKYKGIDRANFALDGIRGMTEYTTGNETLLRYEGEICFLRAFLAFDLVKYWGDVPFKTEFTTAAENAYQPRSNRDVIYDQILADLDLAAGQLPWATAASSPERITQGAVRGLKMRVLLHKAGYSLKMDGSVSRPSEEERQKCFQAVISEWNAIQQNGHHGFAVNGYESLWQGYSADINENKETLWEIAFYTSDGGPNDAGAWGTYIGPLTDANSKYGRANAFFFALPMWKRFYDDQDNRRDVNICQYMINAKDEKVYLKKKPDTPQNQYWFPGKWRREWMVGTPKDPNNTDVDLVILRYADLVLMAAEALNETNRTAEAVELLNLVRNRAGIAPLEVDFSNYAAIYKAPKVLDLDFIDDATITGKFRTALYWERGFELCYEGSRKFDLIRWGILKQSIDNIYSAHQADPLYKFVGLNHYPASKNFVSGKHELFPIPLIEIQRNHKLNGLNNPLY